MIFEWAVHPGFEVAGFGVRWYSVIFSATLVAGWMMLIWQITRGGGEEREANIMTAWCVLAVFIGGRMGHLVFYDLERLLADPAIVWRFRQGGLASHGATIGLLTVLWGFAAFKKLRFRDVLDRLSMSVALASATIRIGNLFNSEVVGRPTDQTWGVRFPRYDRLAETVPLRHPSQLYEFVLGMAVLAALIWLDRKFGGEDRPLGLLSGAFLALYFTGRFIVEFFKEYQVLDTDGSITLTMGQWLSVPLAVAGYVLLAHALKHREPSGWTLRNG